MKLFASSKTPMTGTQQTPEPVNGKIPEKVTEKTPDAGTENIEVIANTFAGDRDKAAKLLREAGHTVVVTPKDNKRLLRMIDLRILPVILIIYGLQSLDKSTLAYSSVFGIVQDAHLKGGEYGWLGAIVYVAQLVWQPLVAYFLVKLPIAKFCAVMVLGWGAVLCCMTAATRFPGLMAARFLLGSFESAVAPTFVAMISMWYRRSEQTNRNAAWYAMLGVVNIFGSLISYGLGHIQSRVLFKYQIIFLFCGALTVAFSAIIFIVLPDSPISARFLKDEDKLMALERVKANQMGISSGEWRWDHVKESLLDLKTYLWFALITSVAIPSGGISTFGLLIVRSFGFSEFKTILFNMPFGAVQLISTLGFAWLATRYKVKTPFIAFICIPPIVGVSILLSVPHDTHHRGIALFAFYITSVYPAISPMIYSLSAQNTGGDTKRKFTTAVLFVGQSAGNIIGPNLYTVAEAPEYHRGLLSNLVLFVVIICLSGATALWLHFLNKKHEAARVRAGKPAKPVDLSMGRKRDFEDDENMADAEDAAINDAAFQDLGDLKNEDFIYVY